MDSLPEEILLEIILYLAPSFDILPFSLVNKKFYKTCSSNILWMPLTKSLFRRSSSATPPFGDDDNMTSGGGGGGDDGNGNGDEDDDNNNNNNNIDEAENRAIANFEKSCPINWKLLYFLVSPNRFDSFDDRKKGERILLDYDNTRVSQNRDHSLFPSLTNFSVQTKAAFKAKNRHFYIWEFKLLNHESHNIGIGFADNYFALRSNFVGYSGMNAPKDVLSPSFSLSSDSTLRNGELNGDTHAKHGYSAGDRVTILVDCLDEMPAKNYCKFYVNGQEVGRVPCGTMDINRDYRFTVTFYSDGDVGCIVTPRNLKLKKPLISEQLSNGEEITRDDDCPYVYSMSLLEILPLYKRFVEYMHAELAKQESASPSPSSTKTQHTSSSGTSWFRRLFRGWRL